MARNQHEAAAPAPTGGMFLRRFDGQSKLLLRALMSAVPGEHRAVEVFHKQHRADPEMSLCHFIDKLCEDEVAQSVDRPLSVQPLVCLFPAAFKRNLLSFIGIIHGTVPQTSVLRLLRCLSQESPPDPWVSALCRQTRRTLGLDDDADVAEPLYSTQCNQRLKELSQRLAARDGAGGWATCFSGQTSGSQGRSAVSDRKRKISLVMEGDDEMEQQSKRVKMSVCGSDPVDLQEDTSGGLEMDVAAVETHEEPQPVADGACDSLPPHIQDSVLQIKELLDSQTEWDQSSSDVFKVLNVCDPAQVEMLCRTLTFPDVSESTLPKLCSSILTVSPDLSYSTAATLIRSLLLDKVLSLSEPASRCLVTAVTSLCDRYPRPMCHALIGPVLTERNIGSPQAELLNTLIESCLDSHYRLLLLQMTFQVVWSEAVLTVIHSLLDSKPDVNEEVFTQFTEQLVSQGPHFTKSVKFAKMMLTTLTKYSSHVTAAHKHSLSSCLTLNETFLKKPLHAALKRITHSA